jgi:hypothetical protein
MRSAAALGWAAIPPLLLSALIHSVDPDIGGVAGLVSPTALLSVAFYGAPAVIMAWLSLALAVHARRAWWALANLAFSALIALTLALAQTPRPPGMAGIAHPAIGGTVLAWLFLAAAVVPARALGWPTGARNRTPHP